MKRFKYSSFCPTIGTLSKLLLATYLVISCQGFNIKTRQLCCNLGSNYSSNGQSCRAIQTPIPGVPIEDERACLNTVDFCCKKQLREIQCNLGQEDAKKGTCSSDDGDRKDCCDACQMGIDIKKAGENCIDVVGFGSPHAEAFKSCCEEVSKNEILSSPLSTVATTAKNVPKSQTDSAEGSKYSKFDGSIYPGLSEENVCETGEFCAQLCEPTGKTFKCACFEGYELMKDGVSCKPIKRAKGSRCERNNPCDHDCIDTGTAIECSCRKGYELATDKRTCKDIDECALGIHECEPSEECENDEGTYFCFVTELSEEKGFEDKCPTGLKFNAEKSVCDDVDECEIDLTCRPPKVCKNSIGSFSCEGPDCPPGFYYKASIESCADIDECVTGDNDCNKESQICLNTKGNYTCVDKASRKACPPGFKKNDLTFFCEDINECEDDIKVCLKEEKCVNEEGGYKCVKSNDRLNNAINNNFVTTPRANPYSPLSCPQGFKFNFTQNTCDDVNECQLRVDNCSPMHRCDNTIGSFYCTRTVSCGTGYTLNSANDLCEDDDECALGTHNCYELGPNYKCKNQMGTYRCEQVRPAYRPMPVRPDYLSTTTTTTTTTFKPSTTTTTPAKPLVTRPLPTRGTPPPYVRYQPSKTPLGNPFWQFARPSESTVPAFYPSMTFSSSATKQIPITTTPIPSRVTIFSWTTPRKVSSYPIINGMLKKCLPGYKMNEQGDCEDINECESNPCPRGLKCLNFNGRYECSSPLQCKIGYEANEAEDDCIDVNECSRGTHKCNKSQICRNGQGYYTCECPPGHHLSRTSQMCEDIDECKYYRPCGNMAECTNTVGSYECQCRTGFRRNQSFCEDVNECVETPGMCDHNCVNVWGSYRCACNLGFTLNNDNRTCTDIDECEKFRDRKLCIGACKNVPGSYICDCPKGYKLGNDKRVCIDIDECEHNVCAREDACVNTRGGYKCFPIICTQGYMKDHDHKARCKRQTCDPRNYQCLLMPEQYSYQYMALVSNLPLSPEGIPLFKIKGPDWSAAGAQFSLKLLEVNCPPGIERVNDSFFKKVSQQNNLLELFLVRSIQGPQDVKLQVEMKLHQGNTLLGSVVVYIVIVVSEYTF